jgi:hypothetical protein
VISADYVVNWQRAKGVQADLERNLDALAAPKGSQLQDRSASSKPRQAIATATYVSRLTHEEVQRYYETQLAAKGWRPCGVHPIRGPQSEELGEEVRYCEGDPRYRVSVETAQPPWHRGWDFAVNFTWEVAP